MPFAGEWCKVWIYFGFVFAWTKGARPRFDTSTDMGLVLIPADAEVDSVIFRLRATDQDADFPLVFEITATITPVVRIDNLPCTLYNKVCQANVILTKRLVPGRLHDFAVRVRDTKGDSNSMQATISVTNATTPRDKIFPHIPALIMVPEDTKPGKELDYLLVRANSWSGKPVYVELWQPKELFTIRQRQTPTQTRGVITLIGELDFETQSMYTLTMYATDPYTEPGKDTRNIAGLSVVVIVQDVQDVPPIFTLAPPLTRINNSVQPGDIIIRVHAEDGDKGVPREIVYGLVSEGNPFTPFFNISETSGEITLARPLEELTQITHVGAPVVLTVVAEEIRRSREEPPAQATVVDVGFLLGEPGNSPPYFESDNYVATIDENPEPGTLINFVEQYSTKVKDEDIGKAGVFALKLENNNGTFEINPTVAERTADFVISVRDNTLIDYELYQVLSFKIIAQEVGPATNLSTTVPVTIHLRDINDNLPVFEEETYEVTLSENVTMGSRVVQVHATDKDTGAYGSIRYTDITGEGSEAFTMDPDTGLITVAMGSSLDREIAARLILSIEARDENGNGNRGVVPLIVNLLDVNDNAPIFEKDTYEFMLNADLTNFTSSAIIKAIDGDAEPPNNVVRYELVHGNYENKFYLNETSGELTLRSPITKIRQKKQSAGDKYSKTEAKKFVKAPENISKNKLNVITHINENETSVNSKNRINSMNLTRNIVTQVVKRRRKRAEEDTLYTLTARAYDLGVPHLSSVTKIRIISGATMEARIMMFVVPGEQPDSKKTAETLAAITGGRVTVLETRPYIQQNHTGSAGAFPAGGKKSIIVARVEQTEAGTSLVDVDKIREALAANGVGIIGGTDTVMNTTEHVNDTVTPINGTSRSTIHDGQTIIANNTFASVHNEEVTVYKAENKLLLWLLIILGLFMLLAIAVLIICCICPGCPFYMAPRKRRVHSSETLIARTDGRPRRHLHRQPATIAEVSWNGRKQAWSADPTRRNWQFNKRNVKNCSLPGDVAYISGQPNNVHVYLNTDAQRLRDGPSYDHSRRTRMNEEDRMYMEDVEGQKGRGYDTAEMESLQQHEMERGSDLQRQAYRQRYMEHEIRDAPTVREQHFYREGNAEVLRLVTRGQVEDATTSHAHHHRPTTLIVDGKDIILQRFIEDQNSGQELSMQDVEAPRSMESHHRIKEAFQHPQPAEIILIPDRLELGHRQHIEEIGPNVQRLVIDHGDYDSQKMEKESQMRDSLIQDKQEVAAGETLISERPTGVMAKEHVQTSNAQYSLHDIELARQNALLTRLLLERENRRAGGGGGIDTTSYLETQSLPGQVAIATQTDRSAATQTERQVRSRSDNDESDEESRHRKKLKSRKKYGDGDWRRSRTLWMKSPIEEEGSPRFDKRLSILRKKVKEVKERRQGSLEPDVLKEISDSLNGNGSSNKGDDDETGRRYRKTIEKTTSIGYKMLNQKENESQSSEEMQKGKLRKSCEDMTDDQKTNLTESTSSPEIKIQREKRSREKVTENSPKKDGKSKTRKKSEGTIKPSFKILEKEFTILTKKLSRLGERKCQESTGSDSTSQEKSECLSRDTKKELEQKNLKKLEVSSGQKQTMERTTNASKMESKGKQKKEAALVKGKQKLKYQQTQVMSTGSSEYDDSLDRPKKLAGTRQDSVKQKGHLKLKRVVEGDKREVKKQVHESRDEDLEKRKDGALKEVSKVEVKQEKVEKGKAATRATKLATLSRRDVIDEGSIEDKKDGTRVSTLADVERESNTEFSEWESSNGLQQRETFENKIVQGFSDDFVEQTQMERIEEKVMTSTKKDEAKVSVEDKIIVKSDSDADMGQLGADESMEGKGSTEMGEGTSIRKVIEDSTYPKSGEQLITGQTINGGILTKDEKLIGDGKTPQDNIMINVIRSEEEFINALEAKKLEDSDVKSIGDAESKQSDVEKIEGNGKKDIGISETAKETAEPVQKETKADKGLDGVKQEIESKSEGKLQESKQPDGELDNVHTQQKAEKVSKDVEIRSEPIDPFKVMRVVHKVEQMYTRMQRKKDVSDDINDIKDKSDAVQAAESKIAMEMLSGESSSGKRDTVKIVEEPIEQDGKSEMQSDDQSGTTQDSVHKSKTHELKSTMYPDDKQEDKRSVRKEDSHMDQVVKEEEKQDTRTIAVDVHEKSVEIDKAETHREEEAVPKVGTDDPKTKESVLLVDRKRYDEPQDESERFITHDQIPKDAVADEDMEISDKKQAAIESITTDQTIVQEAISDQKIVGETIENPEAVEESTESHKAVAKLNEGHELHGEETKDSKISEVLTESHKIVEQPTEDYKTIEHPSEDHKIVEEPNEGHRIVEQLTEDHKIIEEPRKDRETLEKSTESPKMVEESNEDQKIIEQSIEKHKVVEEPTEIRVSVEQPTNGHTVFEEPTESRKIVEQSTEDDNVVEELTKDREILEKSTESPQVVEEPTEDDKIIEQSAGEHKVLEKPAKDHTSVEQPTEDHAVDGQFTEGHKVVEELIEDHKIVEPLTDPSRKVETETDTQKMSKKEAKDSKIPEEPTENYKVLEATSTEKIDTENKKHATDIGDDRMKRNGNIAFDREITSRDEVAATIESIIAHEETSVKQTVVLDKEEKTADTASDDQNKKEVEVEASSREESAIKKVSTDESKLDAVAYFHGTEDGSIENNVVEEHIIKGQDGATEGKEETIVTVSQNSDIKEQEKKTETPEEPDTININEKAIFIEAQKSVDEHTSEKHVVPETSITGQQELITKDENTLPKTLDQDSFKDDVPSIIPDINKDDIIQTEDTIPKIPVSAKQDNVEANLSTETDASTNDNVKKETIDAIKADQTSKKGSVLSDMFKAVHSLVDRLTNGKGSISTSSEAETETVEQKPDDDKIVEKIVPSIVYDDKDKNLANIPHLDERFNLETADESSTAMKEETNIQEVKEDKDEEKITCLTDNNVPNAFKDITEKDLQSNVTVEAKEKQEITDVNDVSKHETEKVTSEKFIEKNESDKFLRDQSKLATNEMDEKAKDLQDSTRVLSEKPFDVDIKSKMVSSHDRIDGKLARAIEKEKHELSSKDSISLHGSELPPTCPQTSETTEEEKFALDSIISETPIDSGKISASEEQLMPASGQTGLQELEQFVEEQTFCPVGDEIRPLPEERPHTELALHLTATGKSVEQDLATEKFDETARLIENTAKEGKAEAAIVEQYADVSIPVFSSIIDPVDDSDDSDSSSDVSRKTTLTTRPYQTPRHHAREMSKAEGTQAMESSDAQDIPDRIGETSEVFDDKESLKDDKLMEYIDGVRVVQSLPTEHLDKVDDKESRLSKEQSTNIHTPLVQQKPAAATDMGSTQEEKHVKSKDSLETDAKPSSTAKRSQDKKLGSETKNQSGKNTSSSTTRVTKTDTFKVADRKTKDRVVSQIKKKVSSEESSEEKATHPRDVTSHVRYRTRKKPPVDQTKRKDNDQTKQFKRTDEEPRRRQSLSKFKREKDKKSSSGSEKHPSPPKTGEIDTSKAQPKYMAWYKKNREEMEKKRAELMATDDEEQLPRWLRRSMRSQKSEKEDKKAVSQRTAAEMTPRSKRKVKPLVNVESEQLKAIVRQGRMLRKAEGGQNEDPPVQIFATTPPALPQADLKHRLVQHSAYKYEKMPGPFYLHPPPAPHPSPELSPEHFDIRQTTEHGVHVEDFDPSIAVSLQGGNRLRHQQLLEKKSVFDIAYSEAAPSQLRSDSTTPPS